MHSIRLPIVLALIWAGGLAAAQVSDVKQMIVPTPPFEMTSPSALSPDDLSSTDVPLTIRNFSDQPLTVRIIRTVRAKEPTESLPEKDAFYTVPSWTSLKIASGTAQTAQHAVALLKANATRQLTLELRVRRGEFAVETRIPLAHTSAGTATARVANWSLALNGDALNLAILPVVPVKTMSCKPVSAGWVQGNHGALEVMAIPAFSPSVEQVEPLSCPEGGTASNVEAVRLSLKSWSSAAPAPGDYTGTLTLPVKGSAGTFLKVAAQVTWPLIWAILCVLGGVFTGLLLSWLGNLFTAVQQDRVDAADARAVAQKTAAELNRPFPQPSPILSFGQRLSQPFTAAVDQEYTAINQDLRGEWGLSRNAAQAAAMSKRVAIFKAAPSEYTRLVTALDALLQSSPGPNNRLEQRIAQWMRTPPVPAVPTLGEMRALAELYLSLRPVWLAFEQSHGDLFVSLDGNRQHVKTHLAALLTSTYAPLVPGITDDMRDAEVNLDLARNQLDTLEPSVSVAAEIRNTLARANTALSGAVATLNLIPSTLHPAAIKGATVNQPRALTFEVLPATPLERARDNARRQRTLLSWTNIGLLLLSAVVALLIGLNTLYFGKAFGPLEGIQAFTWGVGTKLGLDSLYSLADRLLQRSAGRPTVPTV